MSSVYVCLDENSFVIDAISADSVDEAQEACSAGVFFVKHINGMPFASGWFWNNERFEER
jgi:hypothetical protein